MDLFIVTDILNGLGVLPYYVIHTASTTGFYARALEKSAKSSWTIFVNLAANFTGEKKPIFARNVYIIVCMYINKGVFYGRKKAYCGQENLQGDACIPMLRNVQTLIY